MSYKNINSIESELIQLLERLKNLIEEYPDKYHDLNLVFSMSQKNAEDLILIKASLEQAKGNESEVVFKDFLININNFIKDSNLLLDKEFKKK